MLKGKIREEGELERGKWESICGCVLPCLASYSRLEEAGTNEGTTKSYCFIAWLLPPFVSVSLLALPSSTFYI